MKRLLPHPVLAGLLFVLWLLLHQSIGLGHVLVGLAVAIASSLAAAPVIDEPLRLRRPLRLLQLIAVAGFDVVRSNLAVLFVLLHPRPQPTAGFIRMRLELTNTFGLAILACLLTAIPGSAWLEYDRAHNTVLIHVFDLVDEEEWVRRIRVRYESLLLEIFQ